MYEPKSVGELKLINFLEMSLNQQIDIKKLGRPMPDLQIYYTIRLNNTIKEFNQKIYNVADWICGCVETNSFYCFPCILYGGAEKWTKCGENDFQEIRKKIYNHAASNKHKENINSLAMLGKNSNFSRMHSSEENLRLLNNMQVKEMKEVLSKLIDSIKCIDNDSLPVHSYATSTNSKNSSNFSILRKLRNIISDTERNVTTDFKHIGKFNWNSKEIVDETLDCILRVIRQQIKEEINRSLFLSIIVTGVSQFFATTKAMLIVRYVKDCTVVERFWGFLVPDAENTSTMEKCILKELEQILPDCPEKLIAQSYDGSRMLKNAHLSIRKVYPNAVYCHCYAHHLYSVMKRVVSKNKGARQFFINLQDLYSFLSDSSERAGFKKYYRSDPSKHSGLSFGTVEEYQEETDLLKYLQDLKNDPSVTKTVAQAARDFDSLLQEKEFNFWLNIFYSLLHRVNDLNNKVSFPKNSIEIKKDTLEFIQSIKQYKKALRKMNVNTDVATGEILSDEEKQILKQSAQDVYELIEKEMIGRFKITDIFDISNIFLVENFSAYEKNVPQNLVDTAVKCSSNIESVKLQSELSVLYNIKDINSISSPLQFLQFILAKNIETTFSETVKLLKLILTLPIKTSEEGTCFLTLKLLKKFLRSMNSREHLTALAALHMEKAIVTNMSAFNDKVIDLFLSNPARNLFSVTVDEKDGL